MFVYRHLSLLRIWPQKHKKPAAAGWESAPVSPVTGVCRDPTEQYPALMHVNLSARSHAGNQTINMPEVLYLEKQAQRCSAASQFNLLIMAYSPGDQVSWIPTPGALSVDARLPSVPSAVAETFFLFRPAALETRATRGYGED